jgi:CubicO group peptidase (beta-lactamase class C family)
VSEPWAAAHRIPPDDYQARFDALYRLGFRLTWVQAYGSAAGPRFNAVWVRRAGAPWEAHHGIPDADYQAHFNALYNSGQRLRCVSAYLDGAQVKYATLWDREPSGPWQASHGIPASLYQAHFNEMHDRGNRLVHLNVCGGLAEPIFATVWEPTNGADWLARHDLDADAWQVAFEQAARDGFRLRQVSAYESGGRDLYAGIWEREGPIAWQGRHRLAGDTYQLEFEDLRLAGFRPVCVSGCGTSAGDRFAAVFDNYDLSRAALELIDREARGFMSIYGVPGISLAFAREGRLVYARALGTADAAGAEVLRTRHRMRIASVSKPITATAVYMLIQRDRLGLGDQVFGSGALLGTRYGTQSYGANLLSVRLHHLLEHTSGAWDNAAAGTTDDYDGMDDPMFLPVSLDHTTLIGQVLDTYPVDPPGTRWAYSNFGYCLLGRILEHEIGFGLPYSTIVAGLVLNPAGITSFDIAGNTLADRRPWEVEYVGQSGENPYDMNVARMDAHGGWIGTAVDLVRFAVHVDGRGGKPALLTPGSVMSMTTPTALKSDYASGWAVNAAPNRWHVGSLPGTLSILVTTADGMSWAALCNSRVKGGDDTDAMAAELDATLWRIVNGVGAGWPDYDLFAVK